MQRYVSTNKYSTKVFLSYNKESISSKVSLVRNVYNFKPVLSKIV